MPAPASVESAGEGDREFASYSCDRVLDVSLGPDRGVHGVADDQEGLVFRTSPVAEPRVEGESSPTPRFEADEAEFARFFFIIVSDAPTHLRGGRIADRCVLVATIFVELWLARYDNRPVAAASAFGVEIAAGLRAFSAVACTSAGM